MLTLSALRRRSRPVLVTTLPLSDHLRRRRVYLATMSVRTLCLVLVVLVPAGPWSVLLLAASVVLPMFAVVGANSPRCSPVPVLLPAQRHELR